MTGRRRRPSLLSRTRCSLRVRGLLCCRSGVAPFLSCKPSNFDLSPETEELCLVMLMLSGISLVHRGHRGQ